jgi:tetraacyldisaccharide 4'-kinase
VLAAGRKLFAFCGIGNPPAFLTDLQERHFAIVGHRFFRDHHRYTPQDTAALEAEARKAGADALICTEKDAVNLSGAGLGSLDVFYGQISLHIDREEEFWRTVMAVARSGKPSFA